MTEELVTASGGQSLWAQNTLAYCSSSCVLPPPVFWGLLVEPIRDKGHTVSWLQPHPQCINACWLPCWYPGVLGGALCCQNRPGEALSPHPSCYLWETLQLPRSHFQLLKRLPGASKGSALPRGTPARRLPACQPEEPPPPLRSFQATDGLGTPICHPPCLVGLWGGAGTLSR